MAAEVALEGLSLINRVVSAIAFLWPLQGPLVNSSVPAALCLVFVLPSVSLSLPPLPLFHLLTKLPFELPCTSVEAAGSMESTGYFESASPGFKSWL